MKGRETDIRLFNAFTYALRELVARDQDLVASHNRRKAGVTHRLAMYLEEGIAGTGLFADVSWKVKGESGTYTPDIIVHDRHDDIAMALWWDGDYLTGTEREAARDFHKEFGCLALAFSILDDKDYFLVYRFDESWTDYLHISRDDFSEEVLMRRPVDDDDDDGQLFFDMPRRRSRKKDAAEEEEKR